MAVFTKPSVLAEIDTFGDCDVALFTTFNFDISFFDRSILPLLSRKRTKICIFADSTQFQESIKETYNSSDIGKHYYLKPVSINKAFHPKIILLLGKKKAKLIVSSANLTYSSHYSNNELYQAFTYNDLEQDQLNLFIDAFSFIQNIAADFKDDYVQELIDYINEKYDFLKQEKVSTTFPLFLTSYFESIFSQISKYITNDVKEIRAAVPFYDDDLFALTKICEKYNHAKIQLYLQDNYSTFPKEKFNHSLIDQLFVFNSVKNNGHDQKYFYHGKLFAFITEKEEFIVCGSPNFSRSALTQPYKTNGNIEACIFDKKPIGFSDSLFDLFGLENIDLYSLNVRKKEPNQKEELDVSFIKGCFNGDSVEITVKTKLEALAKFMVNGINIEEYEVKRISKDIINITFPNVLNHCIFDVGLIVNNVTYPIKCFISDTQYLRQYINSSIKNPFKDFSNPEEIESYEKTLFLQQFELITNDIRLGIQEKNALNSQKNCQEINDDTSYDENDDDEEDSAKYETPDYIITIGSQRTYSSATKYLEYYTNKANLLLMNHDKNSTNNKKGKVDIEEEKEYQRKQKSFIEKTLKYFSSYADLNNEKLDGLDFKTYYNLYELFSETFIIDLYINKNRILDISKMVMIKIDFLINRLLPSMTNDDYESSAFEYLKREIALLCLECYEHWPQNANLFKNELIKLDKYFDNRFIDEIEQLMNDVGRNLDIDNILIKKDYFNRFIINSPKINELEKIIINHFNVEVYEFTTSFHVETDSFTLNIDVKEKKKGSKPVLSVPSKIREDILNYVKRCYDIEINKNFSFEILISNYSDYISLLKCEWRANEYNKYVQTVTYKNNSSVNETKSFTQ